MPDFEYYKCFLFADCLDFLESVGVIYAHYQVKIFMKYRRVVIFSSRLPVVQLICRAALRNCSS